MKWGGSGYLAAIRATIGPNNMALADVLEWLVRQQRVRFLYHQLDDYITLGALDSTQCQANLS